MRSSPFKGRNRVVHISALQASIFFGVLNQGRRAPLRFALAPGFHISRLWRCQPWAEISEHLWRCPPWAEISERLRRYQIQSSHVPRCVLQR